MYTLLFLDLPSLLQCHLVCHYWQQISNDNLVWRDLFYRQLGWRINRPALSEQLAALDRDSIAFPPPASDTPAESTPPRHHRPSIVQTNKRSSILFEPAKTTTRPAHSLALDWMALYRERLNLHRAWIGGEPRATSIAGHADSVYCVEFDGDKIVTGSRDRTIKVWDLRSCQLRQTLQGHEGSVLCLKFERSGFMVSGSSDRAILVWDLNKGAVTTKLTGHTGGVLDIRLDKDWIVSWCVSFQLQVTC